MRANCIVGRWWVKIEDRQRLSTLRFLRKSLKLRGSGKSYLFFSRLVHYYLLIKIINAALIVIEENFRKSCFYNMHARLDLWLMIQTMLYGQMSYSERGDRFYGKIDATEISEYFAYWISSWDKKLKWIMTNHIPTATNLKKLAAIFRDSVNGKDDHIFFKLQVFKNHIQTHGLRTPVR